MDLTSDKELHNTKEKLHLLETAYERLRNDKREAEHLREVTMESLWRMMNQLKEEIARYEAHHPAARS